MGPPKARDRGGDESRPGLIARTRDPSRSCLPGETDDTSRALSSCGLDPLHFADAPLDILGTGSNILLIVLGFGLLIALHELGHFLAARWAGIRADGFAIGMGPVVVSFRKGVGLRLGSCDEVVKDASLRMASLLSLSSIRPTLT